MCWDRRTSTARKRKAEAFDKSGLASLRGIIGFDIHFADATGHFDLWDGSVFSDEYQASHDYWTLAKRIWLWKAVLNLPIARKRPARLPQQAKEVKSSA